MGFPFDALKLRENASVTSTEVVQKQNAIPEGISFRVDEFVPQE